MIIIASSMPDVESYIIEFLHIADPKPDPCLQVFIFLNWFFFRELIKKWHFNRDGKYLSW